MRVRVRRLPVLGEKNETERRPVRRMLRRFWPWVRPHLKYVWVLLGLSLLSMPIGVLSPLIVRRVVDDAVERGQGDELILWGGILLGMTLFSVAASLLAGYARSIFYVKVFRGIRLRIHRHMQRLSVRYYSDKETGYLMSRQVDDVDNLGGVMADVLGEAVIGALEAVAFLFMLFYVEWRLASAGIVFVVLVFAFQFIISGRLRKLSKANRECWTEVNQALHQAISGHALILATASERREARRFAHILHRSIRADLRRTLFGLFSSVIMQLIGSLGPLLIVLIGAYLVITSGFTIGGLFAFFMYLTRLFGAVQRVAGMNPALQNSLASLERIYEVLDTDPEVSSPAQPTVRRTVRGEVTFEDVSFEYEAEQPVLQGIDLVVPARTMVALVGPSGAGKTTLANLLPRFFDPTSGRVLIDGVDLRDFDLAAHRSNVGYVPQDVFLFDRTVAENIAYGRPRATREEIENAARAAHALEFIQDMTDGLDTVVGERGVRLSGGQRQRIAIAREILRDPSILVLDEATSSLDSESEYHIQRALDQLLMDRTSFVIAHRLSTILQADQILVLEDGKVVQQGPHAKLVTEDGIYQRLYQHQFERDQKQPTRQD